MFLKYLRCMRFEKGQMFQMRQRCQRLLKEPKNTQR